MRLKLSLGASAMPKLSTFVTLGSCVAILAFSNFVSAQDVIGSSNNYFSENVTPDIGYSSVGFGYPATGEAACNTGGNYGGHHPRFEEFKRHWDHTMREAEKVEARNGAWPRPFACADRQLYFGFWEPMINSGFRAQSTLSNAHFDEENELNGLGKATIAMIMNRMPEGQRNVFIHRSGEQKASDARLAHVKDVVATWYAGRGDSQIAFTDTMPVMGNGSRYETINRAYFENTPPPIIAVATGTGGTSDTGQ